MSVSFYCGCGFHYEGDDIDGDQHQTLSCCNCGGRKCMGCVCRMVHDRCQDDCPSCCPEYEESLVAQAAGSRLLRIEELVEKHRWTGGYDCACGAEMNSPQTWSRHVLEDALAPHPAPVSNGRRDG